MFLDPLTESEEYKRAEESRTSDIELEAEGDEIDLSSTNPLNQDLPVSGVVTNLIIQFETILKRMSFISSKYIGFKCFRLSLGQIPIILSNYIPCVGQYLGTKQFVHLVLK